MTLRPKVFFKDPDATLDYFWDWTAYAGESQIVHYDFIVPPGIEEVNRSRDGNRCYLWLKGGQRGNVYNVTCRVTFDSGVVDDRSIRISVVDR